MILTNDETIAGGYIQNYLLSKTSRNKKSSVKARFWKLITGLWKRDRIGYRLRETDPQSFCSRFFLFHKVLLGCFLQALPAAGAWLIIGLIRVSSVTSDFEIILSHSGRLLYLCGLARRNRLYAIDGWKRHQNSQGLSYTKDIHVSTITKLRFYNLESRLMAKNHRFQC